MAIKKYIFYCAVKVNLNVMKLTNNEVRLQVLLTTSPAATSTTTTTFYIELSAVYPFYQGLPSHTGGNRAVIDPHFIAS